MGRRRRRVVWTRAATAELDEIAAFTAQDAPRAAGRVVSQLLASAERLDELGERGRVVPEVEKPAIRELLVLSFRMIYQVSDSEVAILGVLHQRRDFADWRRSDVEDGSDAR